MVVVVVWVKRKAGALKELKELMNIVDCVLMSKTKLVKSELKIYTD